MPFEGDVWEGVQKLGPAAAASLAAVFISGGSKIEDENFIATYFVLKHDAGTLGGCDSVQLVVLEHLFHLTPKKRSYSY